jgi:hypothetical protein
VSTEPEAIPGRHALVVTSAGVPALSAEMLGRTGRSPDPAGGRPRSGAQRS